MTDTRKLVERICQRVASGKLDLRDVGVLLTGEWDQDTPAALLAAAARVAETDEALRELLIAVDDVLDPLSPGACLLPAGAAKTYALEHIRNETRQLLNRRLVLK